MIKYQNYLTTLNKNKIAYFILALLFLSPILYVNALYNPSHVPRMTLLSIASILGLWFLFITHFKSQSILYFNKIHWLVLLLLVWSTLSIIWTVDYGNYAYEIINLWGLVAIFFISSQIANFKLQKILILTSVVAASYASIIALMQNYGLNPSFINPDISIMSSTFGFKNHFALYLDLIIPLSLALVIITKDSKIRIIITILSSIIIGTLLELHTRGSWLTLSIWLIVCLATLFIIKNTNSEIFKLLSKRKFELLTVLILSLSIFLSKGEIDRTWSRPVQEGEVLDTSSKDRLLMYYNSLGMIKDHPLTGVGYGAFWKGFRKYMNHPLIIKRSDGSNYIYRLHNDPLQYFTEIGIPGGILVITIFFYITYMGYKLLLVLKNPEQVILLLGLLMSTIACGVHSLIDFPLHKPSSAIQFWVTMGLISSLYLKHFNLCITTKRYYINLALFITLLYTLIASTFHYKNITGNYYHKKSLLAKDCKSATENMDLSIKEGGFYLISHARRVYIHIKCKTPTPILLDVLNEELNWDPTNVKALYFRGQIFLRSGYPEISLSDFNKIIELVPHRWPAKIAAVSALLKMERKDEAIKLTKQIIEQHPELEDAKKMLEEISQ